MQKNICYQSFLAILGDRNCEGTTVWNLEQKTTSLSKLQVRAIEKIKVTLAQLTECHITIHPFSN